MSEIKIYTANKRFKTAKNLYGIFLEDINRAVDGGLYPELLRNRSFEDSIPPIDCVTDEDGYALTSVSGWRDEFNHGEGLSRWVRENNIMYTQIPAWYAENAIMELSRVDRLNQNRQVSLKVNFSQKGRIYNAGFCGIPQEKGKRYEFYMFAKAENPVNINISIRSRCNNTTADVEVLNTSVRGDYSKYSSSYVSTADIDDGEMYITCEDGGELILGFISLMPADTFMGHGLRKDIAEKLQALKPAFFRFPGGCIVEGFTMSTAMRFKNTVGPVWERPGHQLMWHYRSYDGMGFHEYLQFCEDLDMEPMYVFNCGMTCQARKEILMEGKEFDEMLQDTLDAIEYAIGDETTKWGSLRASMGHPKPFKLNYVEIGNENWGEAYEKRYKICYDEIKKRYPHIYCVANSHLEDKGLPADIVDEHYYETAEFFMENTHMYDNYNRKRPEVFLGEVAVVRGYVGELYGAIGESAFFIGVERNQDIVTMASYAPLLENVKYNAWFPNLIRFNGTKSFGIPSYYVWKMFGSSRGDYVVKSTEQSDMILRPVSGRACIQGRPGLKYRNALWNGLPVKPELELSGRVKSVDGRYVVYEADKEQRTENSRYNGVDLDNTFIIFENGQERDGIFEIEMKAEAGRELILGISTSPLPKQVYISDETNPPKEWNVENVKAFLWKMKNGKSVLQDWTYPGDIILDENDRICMSADRFHKFKYIISGSRLTLSVDGVIIHEINLPSYPVMTSVVTDTDDEIFIKLTNTSDKPDNVKINLDCEVETDYTATVLTGDKEDINTFENMQKVCDVSRSLTGAAKNFVYQSPAYSVNVLKLTKKK